MEAAAICHCPTCGSPYTAERPRVDLDRNIFICAAGAVPLKPSQAEIAHTLLRSYPEAVAKERLLAAMYGGASGPEGEDKVLHVQVFHLRRQLSAVGWTVKNKWHFGYRLEEIREGLE